MTDDERNKAVKQEVTDRPQPLYTMTGVAEIFDVSYRTVQRWIKKGELRIVRPGGLPRIEPAEVKRLIDESRS